VILAALVMACVQPHGPALPALPGQGGPLWIELQSEHFTLWTDVSEKRGRFLIREMEHLRQIVLGVGLAAGEAKGRSLAIALRDAEEVGVYVPKQFIAYSWGGGPTFQPTIIIPADVEDDQLPVITHELTHVISYNIIHHQPHWFAEGLANFFETARLNPDNATGDLGQPLDHIVARLRTKGPLPVAAMFACEQTRCMDDQFYATAWATFSFLANVYPKELLAFTDRLELMPNATEAWVATFPKLTPDAFDAELRDWLKHGKHMVWRFNVKLQDWPVTKRLLSDADVLAARGLLRYMFSPERPDPPAELTDALKLEPTHVLAAFLSATIHKSAAADEARKLTSAHPDDWHGWWLLWWALEGRGEEGHTARDKTCTLMVAARITPPPTCARP
jgi:hypothetical protein